MKGLITSVISIFILSSTVAFAQTTPTTTTTPTTPTTNGTMTTVTTTDNTGMWICTTNASSAASGSPEELADNQMANTAKGLNESVQFAYQHCRDCTKITCTKQ